MAEELDSEFIEFNLDDISNIPDPTPKPSPAPVQIKAKPELNPKRYASAHAKVRAKIMPKRGMSEFTVALIVFFGFIFIMGATYLTLAPSRISDDATELVTLPDRFVVNLSSMQDSEEMHYLKIESVQIEADARMAEYIRDHMEKVEDRISSTIKSVSYDKLQKSSADKALRKSIVDTLNSEFSANAGGKVTGVVMPQSFGVK